MPRGVAANKQKSHMQTVERWSIFERYLLEFCPDEPYTAFVRKCRTLSDKDAEPLAGDERCVAIRGVLLRTGDFGGAASSITRVLDSKELRA